jgi:hypothetical protein
MVHHRHKKKHKTFILVRRGDSHLEYIGIDEKILKWTVKKQNARVWTAFLSVLIWTKARLFICLLI